MRSFLIAVLLASVSDAKSAKRAKKESLKEKPVGISRTFDNYVELATMLDSDKDGTVSWKEAHDGYVFGFCSRAYDAHTAEREFKKVIHTNCEHMFEAWWPEVKSYDNTLDPARFNKHKMKPLIFDVEE